MSLDFITADPADASFDSAATRMEKLGKERQAIGVDAAIRGGVSDMLSSRQPAGQTDTPPPAPPVDQPTPQYQTPRVAAPTGDQPAPAPLGSPVTPQFQTAIATQESGPNQQPDAVNSTSGYRFRYGFGKAALSDAGVYQASPGEDLNDPRNAWTGTFKVPGYGAMNYGQFASNGNAQDVAFKLHMDNVDKQIQGRPALTQAIGKDVPGLPGIKIDEDKLRAMVQAGGAQGTEEYLASNGASDPHQIGPYLAKLNGVQPGAPAGVRPNGNPGAPDYAVPRASFMPSASVSPPGFMGGSSAGSRFDPVLARLAEAPGGGAAALGLMNQQGRFDQQNFQRTTQASKLAMTALARGDVNTAKYWASYAGIPTDTPAFQPGNDSKAFGEIGLLSQRLYGPHTPQGVAFATAYLNDLRASGDKGHALQQAFNTAGPPANNQKLTFREVIDEAGKIHTVGINPYDNTAAPTMGADGQPVVGDQRGAGKTTLVRVRQTDGSERLMTRDQSGHMSEAADESGQPVVAAPRVSAATMTFDHKVDLWHQAGLQGGDALAAASGHVPPTVTPAIVANAYKSSATSIDATTLPLPNEQPQAFAQRKLSLVQQRMDDMFGGNDTWRGLLTAQPHASLTTPAAPAAPAPASPAAPAAAPASLPPALTDTPANRPAQTAAAPPTPATRMRTGANQDDAIPVTDPQEVGHMAPGTWFVPPDGIPRQVRPRNLSGAPATAP